MERYPQSEATPTESAWHRSQAERAAAREQRRARALERARHSYLGALYFSLIGRSAIHKVASTEADPVVSRRRENELMYRWRRFIRSSFRGPTPRL